MPPSYPEPIETKQLPKPDLKPWEQMVASGSGALLTSLFMTPFDVVKVRMQAQTKSFQTHKCFLFCNGVTEHLCACGLTHADVKKFSSHSGHTRLLPSSPQFKSEWFQRPSNFTGTLDAFMKIVRREGLSSLWSGLPPTLVISIPNVMIYFTTYEALKDRFFRFHHARAVEKASTTGVTVSQDMPFWIPLVSGGLARTIAVTCTNPIELVRTKMQSEKLSYREIGTALKLLVRYRGVSGLWMGLPPTLMRDVPFSAMYWSCLEALKTAFNQKEPNPSFVFFAGALSGGVAAVATLPFDIVKTHRQIALGDFELYTIAKKKQRGSTPIISTKVAFFSTFRFSNPSATPTKSKGMLQILADLYRANGIRALFTGLTPRLLKVMPACAIMISSYEAMKIVFHPASKERRRRERSL